MRRFSSSRLFRAAGLALAVLGGGAAAGGAAATLGAREARASVAIAISWDSLVRSSSDVAIVTPLDARSAWEHGRIYTYTRTRVDRALAGTLAAGAEVTVRTLGGIVGDVGQRVEGEAALFPGHAALLFLTPGPAGTFHVTARAQGQFLVQTASATEPALRVWRNPAAGMLVPRGGVPASRELLASDALHGRTIDEAAAAVAETFKSTHGL